MRSSSIARNDSKRRGNCCWPLLACKIERLEWWKGRSVSVILGRCIILAALCWSGTKERDAGWVPCREVPCLALPCLLLQAFTTLMQRLWFEVIRTRQNASRHDLRTRQNALRLRREWTYTAQKIGITVPAPGAKSWEPQFCFGPGVMSWELPTVLFWVSCHELRITLHKLFFWV